MQRWKAYDSRIIDFNWKYLSLWRIVLYLEIPDAADDSRALKFGLMSLMSQNSNRTET